MIDNLLLKDIATYSQLEGVEINSLSKINFIYGANGSGKTTISRLINNPQNFFNCQVNWKNSCLKTYVYNEDFIFDNFHQFSEIKGVFTLGREAKEIEDRIVVLKKNIDQIILEIEHNEVNLGSALEERSRLNLNLTTQLWEYKRKYDELFKVAFTGFRDSTEKFKNKIIKELENNKASLLPEDQLIKKAEVVFDFNPSKADEIGLINSSQILSIETSAILSQKIIGKRDIPIADLITNLSNSDWVKQGVKMLNATGDICPFCQQKIYDNLKNQIEEYFDGSYEKQIKELVTLKEEYDRYIFKTLEIVDGLISTNNKFIDKDILKMYYENIINIKNLNDELLKEKLEKPSIEIELKSILHHLNEMNILIDDAIKETDKHNETIENINSERKTLVAEVWKFISNEAKSVYDIFLQNDNILNKKIYGLEMSNMKKQEKWQELNQELRELEEKITSIVPTVNAINTLISSFGFNSFQLREADKKGCYKIVRNNGEDVKNTLSEGEKTFLTFLYFYYLIQGSNEASGIIEDRIVVFDDPISSLDSDVLFVVSNLISNLINNVRNNTGYIKQVFVLTHNVYFHKELTYKYEGNDFTFWVVRKKNKSSIVSQNADNPILSHYQILWKEIKEGTSISVHNSMRRILEHYFKILGGINLDTLENSFVGDDKVLCRSLISWIHDGSHSIFEDLYVNTDEDIVDRYKEIFKRIFDVQGHSAHYEMMIK